MDNNLCVGVLVSVSMTDHTDDRSADCLAFGKLIEKALHGDAFQCSQTAQQQQRWHVSLISLFAVFC